MRYIDPVGGPPIKRTQPSHPDEVAKRMKSASASAPSQSSLSAATLRNFGDESSEQLTVNHNEGQQQHAPSTANNIDDGNVSECGSSVAHLRGWLDDFGKKNNEHYVKNSDRPASDVLEKPVRPRVSRTISTGPTPLPLPAANALQRRVVKEVNSAGPMMIRSGGVGSSANRSKFLLQKQIPADVQATDGGRASVAKLSKWLADDPTSTKKVKQIRRGMNIISKSRAFDKNLANVVIDESQLMGMKKQRGFGGASSVVDGDDGDCMSVCSAMDQTVTDKKKWLQNAFVSKSTSPGPKAQTEIHTSSSGHCDFGSMAKQKWRKQRTPLKGSKIPAPSPSKVEDKKATSEKANAIAPTNLPMLEVSVPKMDGKEPSMEAQHSEQGNEISKYEDDIFQDDQFDQEFCEATIENASGSFTVGINDLRQDIDGVTLKEDNLKTDPSDLCNAMESQPSPKRRYEEQSTFSKKFHQARSLLVKRAKSNLEDSTIPSSTGSTEQLDLKQSSSTGIKNADDFMPTQPRPESSDFVPVVDHHPTESNEMNASVELSQIEKCEQVIKVESKAKWFDFRHARAQFMSSDSSRFRDQKMNVPELVQADIETEVQQQLSDSKKEDMVDDRTINDESPSITSGSNPKVEPCKSIASLEEACIHDSVVLHESSVTLEHESQDTFCVKPTVSLEEDSPGAQKTSDDETLSPITDFRRARELILQRSKANGNDVKVVSKVHLRKNNFEKIEKDSKRLSASHGLLKPSWITSPSGYVKKYREDIAPKKSINELP